MSILNTQSSAKEKKNGFLAYDVLTEVTAAAFYLPSSMNIHSFYPFSN